MKILVKSAWGSDDPTKAAFPFLHANAFAETGHQPQIFLLGEAVSVMRNPVAADRAHGMAAIARDPKSHPYPKDSNPS